MSETFQSLKDRLLPEPRQRRSEDLSSLDVDSFSRFLDRQVPATANPLAAGAHHSGPEFRDTLRHHPDRGTGYYEYSRAKNWRPSLVESGRSDTGHFQRHTECTSIYSDIILDVLNNDLPDFLFSCTSLPQSH